MGAILLNLTHAGTVTSSIQLNDLDDGTAGTAQPGPAAVGVGETIQLNFAGSVAESYHNGGINAYINAGMLTASFSFDSTYTTALTSSASSFENTVTVSPEGGEYDSIKEALDSITDSSGVNRYVVLVYPGIYAEDNPLTVPDFVSVVALGRHTTTVIECDNTDQHGIVCGSVSDVVGLQVRGASDSGMAGFYIGSGVSSVDLHDITVRECDIGVLSESTESGNRIREMSVAPGAGTTLVQVSGGATLLISDVLAAETATLTNFLYSTGTDSLIEVISANIIGTNITNTFYADNSGKIRVTGAGVVGSTNALRIGSSGGEIIVVGVDVNGGTTNDVLIESADGTLKASGCRLRGNRFSLAAGSTMQATYFNDVEGDEGHATIGELHVGHYTAGSESAFGEGDSHTNGMEVFTNTNEEAGTWASLTDELSSPSGSLGTLFPGVGAGNCCYWGSDLTFPGLKVNMDTAINLGSGALAWEFWDGSAWAELKIMETLSSAPYTQRANDTFGIAQAVHIRFGEMSGWATKTLNGTLKYWVRCRIDTGITTAPVVEQTKLHTNRTEINADGKIEYFGEARPTRDLLIHFKLSEDLSGASPANQSLQLASGITITPVDNRFNNGAVDGNGMIWEIPTGTDTSFDMELQIDWAPQSSGSGDVELGVEYAIMSLGDTLDGTAAVTNVPQVTSVSGQDNELLRSTFSVEVNDAVPGQFIAARYFRDATGGNADDTFAANLAIVAVRCRVRFWN